VGRRTRAVRVGSAAERRACDRFFLPGKVSGDDVLTVRTFYLRGEQLARSAVRAMEAALRGEPRNFVRLLEALEWADRRGLGPVQSMDVCVLLRAHFLGRESAFLPLRSACALLFLSSLLVPSEDGILPVDA
jgi:hypothetical protein